MIAVLTTIASFFGAAFLALLVAVLVGQLVPSSRVDQAEKRADTWEQAATRWHETHEEDQDTIRALRATLEINNQVGAALRDIATRGTPGGGG